MSGFSARVRTRAYIAACLSGLVALVAAAPASAGECSFANAAPGSATGDQLGAATLCLVNRERAAAGLAPLTGDRSLARVGSAYADEMIAHQDFAHRSARSGNVADRVHDVTGSLDRWLELGENLGWGTFEGATPAAIVAGWMQSPTHRDNVLFPRFRRLGVGVLAGAPVPGGRESALTYVAVFGQDRVKRAKRCSRSKRARTRAARRAAARCRAARRAGESARR